MSRQKRRISSKRKYKEPQSPLVGKIVTGNIEITESGKGYIIVKGMEQDIKIFPENIGEAIDGDTVKARIIKVDRQKRPVGEILDIVQHGQTDFIGRLEVSKNYAFLVPLSENIHTDIFIPLNKLNRGENGDIAMARVLDWESGSKNPMGEIIEVLSGERQNDIAMKEIVTGNGFSLNFTKEQIKAADNLSDKISPADLKERKDVRAVTTFTIDPRDAKDFDDALSVRTLENENIEVGVHIADVSHFVQKGSELDEEAYRRATSVYLPDRVIPMLPEHISNVLCSLRPDEDKMTFSVIFQLNPKGAVKQFWIGRTIIRSNRRFTYEEAQEIIETGKGDFSNEICLLHGIAQNLRKKRFDKGAINFSSREVQFQLDEKGIPVGLTVKESKAANQLIEEFMLLANKTVAKYVDGKKVNKTPIPFPYRVHDQPDKAKLAAFASFASRFGYLINLNTGKETAKSFNEMLAKIKGEPEEALLQALGIRTMAKAVYSPENIGHYGLQFKDYCHFTSPIRRYPDIMVHRILASILEGKTKPDKEMETHCLHCSNQERKAMEAEREGNKYKQVEYMEKFLGQELEAIITGVSGFGLWAETMNQKCEGMISMNELLDFDNFEYQEELFCLRGLKTGMRLQMGDLIRIKVLATNLEKRQIDLGLVKLEKTVGLSPKGKKIKKKKS